jgi:hypothetical protein
MTSTKKGARVNKVRAPRITARGKYTVEEIREAWIIFTEMTGGGDWRNSLTPEFVLEQVLADKSHPLRRYLERDVEKAAHQHWISQIGHLMNEVRISVIVTQEPGKVIRVQTRSLVHMPRTATRDAGRRPLRQIRKTKEDRDALARIRAQYLRSWVGATEAQLAAIDANQSALVALLSDVKRALRRFDDSLNIDAAE